MENLKKEEKFWEGAKIPYPYSKDIMFGDLILNQLNESDPKKVLQICADDDTKLTCEDLKIYMIRVAQNLMKFGIKSNDIIGMIIKHSHTATCLINGMILIGAIINPVDEELDEKDIEAIYSKTQPKIIICDESAILKLKRALQNVDFSYQIFSTSDNSEHFKVSNLLKPTNEEEKFQALKFLENSDDKVFSIMCTSGTTGVPKGCVWSHAFITNWGMLASMKKYESKTIERTLCFSPIYWGSGFAQNIMLTFNKSLRIFTKNSFSLQNAIKIIEKYEITNFTLAPSALALLLNSEEFLSSKNQSVQSFMAIGSILSNALRRKFNTIFPDRSLMISYGMTEVGMSITKPNEYKIEGSVGSIIFPNTLLKIVDDNGNRLNAEEVGEICAKSIVKFLGYYKNSEASEEAVDTEGFIKTGDLGYFTKDGVLCVIDRKKNILKYKGYHFNPSEIENEIQQMKGVELVSVVGLPDELLTSATTAAIVKSNNSNLTAQDVINHVASKFPAYKQLHGGVYFFNELPLTPSGKIIKRSVIENILKIRETRE